MKYTVTSLQGKELSGEIILQGAKNSMLANLCVPLLTDDTCTISNVPAISDIKLNLDILASFGARVIWIDANTVSVKCDRVESASMEAAKSTVTTGSKLFIPMMVARFGEYRTGPSGGDRIGGRQFLQYAESLRNFGIGFEVRNDIDYRFFRAPDHVSHHRFSFPSFGVTVNAILAAASLSLDLLLENTCLEAEIDNTIDMINSMGGNIQRVNGTSIQIRKPDMPLKGCTFRNLSDRNAAVTYAVMALTARGDITIRNFDNVKMEAFYKFVEDIGGSYAQRPGELRVHRLSTPPRPVKLSAFLYPEFHSDWQPLVGALLTQASGTSYIEERLFPNRLEHWVELQKMGADFSLRYGPLDRFNDDQAHAVHVNGPVPLQAANVTARNLRAGAALVAAGLIASGITEVENAEEIERGYEDMPRVLRSIGVDIDVTP